MVVARNDSKGMFTEELGSCVQHGYDEDRNSKDCTIPVTSILTIPLLYNVQQDTEMFALRYTKGMVTMAVVKVWLQR